ncbi:MAG: hypothetical protein AAGK78_13920, partial [Planctomycetota bacterium]
VDDVLRQSGAMPPLVVRSADGRPVRTLVRSVAANGGGLAILVHVGRHPARLRLQWPNGSAVVDGLTGSDINTDELHMDPLDVHFLRWTPPSQSTN